MQRLFHFYLKVFVEPIGYAVSGVREAYAYLSRTIARFYSSEELSQLFAEVGYRAIEVHKMLFGAVAVHRGIK